MKAVGVIALGIVLALGFSRTEGQQISPHEQWSVMAKELAQIEPAPGSASPRWGNFYSFQFGPARPPLPVNVWLLPFWNLGDGVYVVDDRKIDYPALFAKTAEANAAIMLRSMAVAGESLTNLHLRDFTATVASTQAMTVAFTLAGGLNHRLYDLLSTTNLLTPVADWTWLGLGIISNRYTFSNQVPGQAYFVAGLPTRTMVVGLGGDYVGQASPP